ncbi:hypothetical protein DTO166G4_5439 [Paecilomyces variotii]|nr:hypothetical protein DTO166G4_5439 [Paecilomyces variotii]KAJ9236146.1 hypothetical protein DTO166G5_4191 [Paecilomyces variotii]
MERPSKRPRLSLPGDSEQFPDDFDVQEARARNDLRLKSVFESIFEKYGKDFTDVGDEIDLQTGKIIVDNGHLSNLQAEGDLGRIDEPTSHVEQPLSPVSSSLDFLPNGQEHDVDSASGELENDVSVNGVEELYEATVHQERGFPLSLSNNENTCAGAFCEVHEPESDHVTESVHSHIKGLQNGLLGKRSKLSLKDAAALTEVTNLPKSKSALSPDGVWERQQNIDPVWQVPEIEAKFSTPTVSKKMSRSPMPPQRARSASPPGAGSIWALPTPGRKRNTDIAKKTKNVVGFDKPKRKRSSTSKKKDWSFAVIPDSSDSDDPLQEDYQPSPTSRAPSVIRASKLALTAPEIEKSSSMEETFAILDTTEEPNEPLPCNGSSRLHDSNAEREQPLSLDTSSLAESGPGEPPDEPQGPEELEEPEKPDEPGKSQEPEEDREPILLEITNTEISQSSVQTMVKIKSQSPVKDNQRSSRNPITPDEARIIMRMRHVEGSSWKDIAAAMPGRTAFQVTQWNHIHWQNRKLNPPKSSEPWSNEDRKQLARFKDEEGMSWTDIQKGFPGHTKAEIEFELLRLWIGGATETDHGSGHQDTKSHDDLGTHSVTTISQVPPPANIANKEKHLLAHTQNDPSTPQRQKRSTSKRPDSTYLDFEDLIETGSLAEDSDGLQTSGLSSIQLDARENGGSSARFKRSPSKSLVSPLAKRSSLSNSRRSVFF